MKLSKVILVNFYMYLALSFCLMLPIHDYHLAHWGLDNSFMIKLPQIIGWMH